MTFLKFGSFFLINEDALNLPLKLLQKRNMERFQNIINFHFTSYFKVLVTQWISFEMSDNLTIEKILAGYHGVKHVPIWSYSEPYFAAFGLNMERYGVYLNIQSKCGKIRTRVTRNADTFQTMIPS